MTTSLDRIATPGALARLEEALRVHGSTTGRGNAEDRLRRLELGLAYVATLLHDEIEHRAGLTDRAEDMEASRGRLRIRR